MTRRLPLLDRIAIPEPCSAGWDTMTGDGAARFCGSCSREVHDLSAMTRRQAEGKVRRSGGRLCIHLTRDAGGKTRTVAVPTRVTPRAIPTVTPPPPLPDWIAHPSTAIRASRAAIGALAMALLATPSTRAQNAPPAANTAAAGDVQVDGVEVLNVSDGMMVTSEVSKAHCYLWKYTAQTDDETAEEIEEKPEPPLLTAIDAGDDELKEALDAGASANERFEFGRTPLMHAADDEDLVRLLIEHGADPTLRDDAGATALHYAALSDDSATVFALCRAGANPDASDFDGVTPLILAAWEGNEDAVTALLAAGASVHARDSKGRTAIELARDGEYETVIEILEVAGAR